MRWAIGRRGSLGAFACLWLVAGASGARPTDNCCTTPEGPGVLLTDLLAGDSLEAGSFRFHDFVLVYNSLEPIDDVEVFALDDDPLRPGFRIDSNGAFVVFGDGQGEFLLEYSVTALDPGIAVEGALFGIDPVRTIRVCCSLGFPVWWLSYFADPGPGEAFLDPTLGLEVDFSHPSNPDPFGPQSSVRASATIGIALSSFGGDEDLELEILETRYLAVIPEPHTSAMLAWGVLGLAGAFRARARSCGAAAPPAAPGCSRRRGRRGA